MATWVRYALTLLVGAGIGFLAGQFAENARTPPLRTTSSPPPIPFAFERSLPVSKETTKQNSPITLAEIMLNPSDFAQTAALYRLAADATVEQLETLLAEAAGLSQISEQRAATSILYERYAELDPPSAVDHILSRGGFFNNAWLNVIFHAWSRRDLPAAIARIAELDPALRSVAGAALLNARDDLPTSERREIAQQLGIEAAMQELESRRQAALTDSDPQDAWRNALAMENRQFRMQRLYAVVTAWAKSDPIAALNAVRSMTEPSMRNSLQQRILQQWGRANPRDAVDWAFARAPSNNRANLLAAALRALALAEPRDAINLAESLSGTERREALGSVLQGWASTDPRAAAQWFDDADVGLKPGGVYGVAMAYAQQYPDEAFDWAISLRSGQSTMVATMAVLGVIGQSDPVYAGRLAKSIPDDNARANATQTVARTWAQSDPRAAARWISGFDDTKERTQLYTSLLQQWASIDRGAAVNYLDRMPTDAERDAATVGMISGSYDDPRFAESLYERIEDDDLRRGAAQQLYHMLRNTDPSRAERYRDAGGLDENGAPTG